MATSENSVINPSNFNSLIAFLYKSCEFVMLNKF